MSDGERIRNEIGQILRTARTRADLTGWSLGDRVELTQSQISKVEHGKSNVSKTLGRRIVEATAMSSREREKFLDLVNALTTIRDGSLATWNEFVDTQRLQAAREEDASHLQIASVSCIPALLQTETYAKMMLARNFEIGANFDADTGAYVLDRMRRKTSLHNPMKRCEFIFWTHLITHLSPLINARSRLFQLDSIIEIGALENVSILLIPTQQIAEVVFPLKDIAIIDGSVVTIDIAGSTEFVEYEPLVAIHRSEFAELRRLAMNEGESAEFIRSARSALSAIDLTRV